MIALHNLDIINHTQTSITIENESIQTLTASNEFIENALNISFDNAIAFPGLINSHDHLEFNLFPKLGNRIYRDYVEWGNDIHKVNKKTIDAILKIPKQLRVQWGLYKNLLNGITTVVHHGNHIEAGNDLINVFQQCNMIHAIQTDKYWKLKLNKPFAKPWPFVVHTGEGTNEKTHEEINNLLKWNLFKRNIFGIHGIAMNEQQATQLKALIWCPDSNLFLYNKTADIKEIKTKTTIMFGTDSTVSSDWSIWEQLRSARSLNQLTDEELFETITTTAAKTWKLQNKGLIHEGNIADLVIAEKKYSNNMDAFYATDPSSILLVIVKGKIVLFDEQLPGKPGEINKTGFTKIKINARIKYLLGDLNKLCSSIKSYFPEALFPFDIVQ